MSKKQTARDICKAAGLSLSQRQAAKNAGIDVDNLEAMKAYRKTLNVYPKRTKTAAAAPPETLPPGESMSMEEIEAELRRPDLDPNTARTLKLRIESLRSMAKYQAEMGLLIPREEVIAGYVKIASATQAFLRRWENEIPQLCLGLTSNQSKPLVKTRTRELQAMLSDLKSEFWNEHPQRKDRDVSKS